MRSNISTICVKQTCGNIGAFWRSHSPPSPVRWTRRKQHKLHNIKVACCAHKNTKRLFYDSQTISGAVFCDRQARMAQTTYDVIEKCVRAKFVWVGVWDGTALSGRREARKTHDSSKMGRNVLQTSEMGPQKLFCVVFMGTLVQNTRYTALEEKW